MKDIITFLIMLALSLLISTILLYNPKAQSTGFAVDEAPSCYHVIRPGDTFWGIARTLTPPEDNILITLDIIRRLNPHLDAGNLRPGTPVMLPGECK